MTTSGRAPGAPTAGAPFRRSLRELAAALRDGSIGAVALVEHALESISALDPHLNAFTFVDTVGARRAAGRADSELADGLDRGPLHGIPVAIKDIIDIAGQPTTLGSSIYLTNTADSDAACVRRLRHAGAVIVGKTTLHEFAYGATGDRSVHGAARNPRDRQRMSGGSSAGSAVAVAAGMVPIALGTDTAGSVRVPAALCGIVGFKPAYGAIPTDGVFPLAESLDHVGILVRSADDARLVYEILSDRDLGRGGVPAARPTIGWLLPEDLATTDPRVTESARTLLTSRGFTLEDVSLRTELTGVSDIFDVLSTIQSSEAFDVHEHDVASAADNIDPEVLARLHGGRDTPAWRYLRAVRRREDYRLAVAALLRRFDVLASPTVPTTAPPVGQRALTINDTAVEVRSTLLALSSPWNLVGLPALSVPAADVDGLPTALQLITAADREAVLFQVAAQLDAPTQGR